MKEKKLNILLNIVTLCLCLCAIAIGVYSVKNASLSVSGSIAFEAHNADVDVVAKVIGNATVTGSGSDVKYGEPTTTETQVGSWNVRKDTTSYDSMSAFYFSDLGTNDVEPITLKFYITNQAEFSVKASIKTATATGVTFYDANDTAFAENSISGKMNAKGDTITLTIVLKLTGTLANSSNNLTIGLYFEQYSTISNYDLTTTNSDYILNDSLPTCNSGETWANYIARCGYRCDQSGNLSSKTTSGEIIYIVCINQNYVASTTKMLSTKFLAQDISMSDVMVYIGSVDRTRVYLNGKLVGYDDTIQIGATYTFA